MAENQNQNQNQSAAYSHGHHESVLRYHASRTAYNSAAYLIPYILHRPDSRVLDVGCGPGTITMSLARLVPLGHVTGLDNAPPTGKDGNGEGGVDLLAQARAHAAKEGLTNVTFAHGDACHLDGIPDGTFDIVHCHQVLQHAHDPVRALREMRRVAKTGQKKQKHDGAEKGEEGGIIAAREVDTASFAWWPPSQPIDDWMRLYRAIARSNGGVPDAGRRLVAWALEAGFERSAVTASASTWCFTTSEERAWIAEMWADRILQSAFAVQAVDKGLADRETLERIAAGWREWATKEDGWLAFIHGEIVCRV